MKKNVQQSKKIIDCVRFNAIFVHKVAFMSETINQLLNSILQNVKRLNDKLNIEKSENQKLKDEFGTLSEEIEKLRDENIKLQVKVGVLNDELNAAKEQKVDLGKRQIVSESQIDEMVKEIEYCIAQLKK